MVTVKQHSLRKLLVACIMIASTTVSATDWREYVNKENGKFALTAAATVAVATAPFWANKHVGNHDLGRIGLSTASLLGSVILCNNLHKQATDNKNETQKKVQEVLSGSTISTLGVRLASQTGSLWNHVPQLNRVLGSNSACPAAELSRVAVLAGLVTFLKK